jgi:hypothetical protein
MKRALWIDERCVNCGKIMDNEVARRLVKKKIKNEVKTGSDPLFIKPTDNNTVARVKLVLQYFRSLTTYTQVAFVGFITFILFVLGMISA